MSVQKKFRRKINVDDTQYVWYVSPDDESPYNVLNIISDDKCVILSVPLNVGKDYIINKGRSFQGQRSSGNWERYLLPVSVEKEITQKFINQLRQSVVKFLKKKKNKSSAWHPFLYSLYSFLQIALS